jgi:hypothetical protein
MAVRVVAIRIEPSWESRHRVRCVARLTRPLTPGEHKRVAAAFSDFHAENDKIVYFCRPEETELRERRLEAALEHARIAERPARGRVYAFPLPR